MVERKAASDAGHDGLPTLFTLLHPLDDLCPTTFRRPAASTWRGRSFFPTSDLLLSYDFLPASPDLTVLGFYSDPSFRVLRPFSDPDSPPFVVCYDSSAGRHLVSVLLAATLRVGEPYDRGRCSLSQFLPSAGYSFSHLHAQSLQDPPYSSPGAQFLRSHSQRPHHPCPFHHPVCWSTGPCASTHPCVHQGRGCGREGGQRSLPLRRSGAHTTKWRPSYGTWCGRRVMTCGAEGRGYWLVVGGCS